MTDETASDLYEYFLGEIATAEGKLGGIIRKQFGRIEHA